MAHDLLYNLAIKSWDPVAQIFGAVCGDAQRCAPLVDALAADATRAGNLGVAKGAESVLPLLGRLGPFFCVVFHAAIIVH